jgi:hypothetical protein
MSQLNDRPAYVECIRQCTSTFESCRLGEATEAAQSSRDAVSDGSAAPPAAGAMTVAEVVALALKLRETGRQQQFSALPMVNPPECELVRGMIRNPAGCLMARNRPREDARRKEQTDAPLLLGDAERSLDADLAGLPADPLARFDVMHELNEKYRPISSFANHVRNETSTRRSANDPVVAAIGGFEGKRVDAAQRVTRDPAVKQAYIEDRIRIPPDMQLPPVEMYDWSIDRKTLVMQKQLKSAGKRNLFSERTIDLRASTRETNEPGNYARWGEPSVDEIGLAILRVFVSVDGEMRLPFESSRVRAGALAALRLDGEQANRLIHLEKAGACEKIAGAAYRCPIRQWMQIFARGNIIGWMADGKSAPVARLWLAAFESAESRNGDLMAVVVKATPSGWQAPELIDALRESDRESRETTRKSLKSQRCSRERIESGYGYMSLDCYTP